MLWFLFLFVFCFFGVHVAKLARLGQAYRSSRKKASSVEEKPTPPKEKAPAPQAQEPVYYIVERKQRRSKANYGEPKEIRFK